MLWGAFEHEKLVFSAFSYCATLFVALSSHRKIDQLGHSFYGAFFQSTSDPCGSKASEPV